MTDKSASALPLVLQQLYADRDEADPPALLDALPAIVEFNNQVFSKRTRATDVSHETTDDH